MRVRKLGGILLIFSEALLPLGVVIMTGRMIDALTRHSASQWDLAILIILGVLQGVLFAGRWRWKEILTAGWIREWSAGIIRRVSPSSPDYTTVLTSDVAYRAEAQSMGIDVLVKCLVALGGLIVVASVSPVTAGVIVVATAASYWLVTVTNRHLESTVSRTRDSYGQAVRRAEEIAGRTRLIRGLRAGESMSVWFAGALRESLDGQLQMLRVNSRHTAWQSIIQGGALLAFVLVVTWQARSGSITLGEAAVCLFLYSYISAPLPWIVSYYVMRQYGDESRRRIEETMREHAASTASGAHRSLSTDTPLTSTAFARLLEAHHAGEPAVQRALTAAEGEEILRRFVGAPSSGAAPESFLSGGQRQRLVLAKALAEEKLHPPLVIGEGLDSVDEYTRAAIVSHLRHRDDVDQEDVRRLRVNRSGEAS